MTAEQLAVVERAKILIDGYANDPYLNIRMLAGYLQQLIGVVEEVEEERRREIAGIYEAIEDDGNLDDM